MSEIAAAPYESALVSLPFCISGPRIEPCATAPAAWRYSPRSAAPHRQPVLVSRLPFWGSGFFGYLSLDVWPSRQARNAAAACSRSSALLNLRRCGFGGWPTTGISPLISSTPRRRRIRRRCPIAFQFVRPVICDHHSKAASHSSKPAALP